ncbi:hypothetical protein AtNW77_Chr4g0308891 [Arabidopsis thaliana]|jgi:hypothetical protein|nr:uncharacterized protein AT4G30662 [Arabidopsis thaliana]ABF59373.1 unknown protein [Arabidopsis thaliana]AEE85793.1 hypothetical protein AT4G30662 [Arabidopsis thaliana]KAG7617925.1 hypothetical protein ISN45_At04g032460 [Arabidopsis thaliana x Arabidopsis arenosa]OAP00210.1 hypothetical protein AXX17_AT4G35150 [Arabidopsis thaliana]|eukprot:NP_001031757.1 hypothetical protein AT4G30662 [Arabidopsis thaliana]
MRTSLAFSCSLIVLLLLLSQPLPISSENKESERRLAQHGDSNPLDHHDSLRVFMRKARFGGVGGGSRGGGRSHRRVPSSGHGAGGSSATSRPCLSMALRYGSTVASSILLMFFAF